MIEIILGLAGIFLLMLVIFLFAGLDGLFFMLPFIIILVVVLGFIGYKVNLTGGSLVEWDWYYT